MQYGYALPGRREHDIALQTSALEEYGCDEIITDLDGAQWPLLLHKLQSDDRVVVRRITNLGDCAQTIALRVGHLHQLGATCQTLNGLTIGEDEYKIIQGMAALGQE